MTKMPDDSLGVRRNWWGAVYLLVGCLRSQQHPSVSQGRICSDSFTYCHTEIEAADQTFYLTQLQYTNTRPTSPSADLLMPGAWQRYCLIGLVVKASASRVEDPGFESRLHQDFFGVDLKIGTPVATLPGAWRYRVSAGAGQPGVSLLWQGEMESLVCNFCLSVTARKIVWADPSLRYTCMLLGR